MKSLLARVLADFHCDCFDFRALVTAYECDDKVSLGKHERVLSRQVLEQTKLLDKIETFNDESMSIRIHDCNTFAYNVKLFF